MREDIDRWNAKYAGRPPSDSIEPDSLLLEHRRLLASGGLCIDLAGGTGNNGLFAAQLGFRSIIVDGSEAGLRLCRLKAQANDLDPMLVVADLDRLSLPEAAFDLVLLFHYLNRGLVGPIRRSLKPGGVLFFKTFNSRKRLERPDFPEKYLVADGELSEWFAGLHCVATNDGASEDATYHWIGYRPEA